MAPGIVFAQHDHSRKNNSFTLPCPNHWGCTSYHATNLLHLLLAQQAHAHSETGTYLSVIIRSLVGTLDQSRHDHIDAIPLHVTVTCTVAWPICSAADSHGLLQVLLRSAMLLDEM